MTSAHCTADHDRSVNGNMFDQKHMSANFKCHQTIIEHLTLLKSIDHVAFWKKKKTNNKMTIENNASQDIYAQGDAETLWS